jgi:phosphoglycerate dehydrogenase-like enzyme
MSGTVSRSVVVTDAAAILAPAIDHLRSNGVTVTVVEEGAASAVAAAQAADSPVVIIGVMPFREAEIATLRITRLIIRAGIGYDMVDIEAATSAGILVANVPDFCVDEVADHTMTLLLAAMRRLPHALDTWRRRQDWHVTSQLPPLSRLRGRRLGLIGLGRIGRQVAARANGFGMEVVGYDPVVDPGGGVNGVTVLDLDEVLRTSDAISLHCPLTSETQHLINDVRIGLLKPGVVLINTSRGGLVDLDVLATAVGSGVVGVAALDVLDGEPNPDLSNPLLSHENVIVTSHMAWYSVEAKHELAINTALEALRFFDGEEVRNVVNPAVLNAGAKAK